MAMEILVNHPRAPGGFEMSRFASWQGAPLLLAAAADRGLRWVALIPTPGLNVDVHNRDEVVDELQRLRQWLPTADLEDARRRFDDTLFRDGPRKSDQSDIMQHTEVALRWIAEYVDGELESMTIG